MTRGGPFSTKTGSTPKRTTTAHRRSRRSCASWAGTERKRLDEALARQAEEGPAQDPQRQEPEHGQVGGAVRGLFLGVRLPPWRRGEEQARRRGPGSRVRLTCP